ILGQETVPDMSIAVNDGHVAVCLVSRGQARSCREQLIVKRPTLRWQPVADVLGKTLNLLRQQLVRAIDCISAGPGANFRTQPGIVPPRSMKARPRTHNHPALFGCWR